MGERIGRWLGRPRLWLMLGALLMLNTLPARAEDPFEAADKPGASADKDTSPEVSKARARLAEKRAALRKKREELRRAEAELLDAEEELANAEDAAQAEATRKGEKALAQSDVIRARDRYSWAEKMRKKGYLSETQLNADRAAYEAAKLKLQALGK